MTVLTKAVDDAGQRISRFLLMQLIINGGFGLVLTLGLFLIQVPHALLWGFLAAILRYVPYLGSWITAGLLVTLSLAVFPGWVQPLLGAWVDRGPRTGHGERRGAEAVRPQHRRLGSGPAGGRRLLGLPVGADRPGPVQPADGLSGRAGQIRPAAGVPRRAPGR